MKGVSDESYTEKKAGKASDGISVREMHKKLWEIYIAEQTKETFISNAESLLESLKRDEENGDHIVCCE